MAYPNFLKDVYQDVYKQVKLQRRLVGKETKEIDFLKPFNVKITQLLKHGNLKYLPKILVGMNQYAFQAIDLLSYKNVLDTCQINLGRSEFNKLSNMLIYINGVNGNHTMPDLPEHLVDIIRPTHGLIIYQEQETLFYKALRMNARNTECMQSFFLALYENRVSPEANLNEVLKFNKIAREWIFKTLSQHGQDKRHKKLVFNLLQQAKYIGPFNLKHEDKILRVVLKLAFLKAHYANEYEKVCQLHSYLSLF